MLRDALRPRRPRCRRSRARRRSLAAPRRGGWIWSAWTCTSWSVSCRRRSAEPSDAFAGAFVGSPVCTVSCAWSWRLTSSSCAMRDMYDCSFTRALADRVLTACSARSSASRSLSIVAINEDGCCLGTCRSSPRCAADRSRIVWVSASGVRYRPTALPRAGDVPVAVASFARPWGPVVLNPADSPRIPGSRKSARSSLLLRKWALSSRLTTAHTQIQMDDDERLRAR